jgi:hypothetical protein
MGKLLRSEVVTSLRARALFGTVQLRLPALVRWGVAGICLLTLAYVGALVFTHPPQRRVLAGEAILLCADSRGSTPSACIDGAQADEARVVGLQVMGEGMSAPGVGQRVRLRLETDTGRESQLEATVLSVKAGPWEAAENPSLSKLSLTWYVVLASPAQDLLPPGGSARAELEFMQAPRSLWDWIFRNPVPKASQYGEASAAGIGVRMERTQGRMLLITLSSVV